MTSDTEGYEPSSFHESCSDGGSMLFSSPKWPMSKRKHQEDVSTFIPNHLDLIMAADHRQQINMVDQLAREGMGVDEVEDGDQIGALTNTVEVRAETKSVTDEAVKVNKPVVSTSSTKPTKRARNDENRIELSTNSTMNTVLNNRTTETKSVTNEAVKVDKPAVTTSTEKQPDPTSASSDRLPLGTKRKHEAEKEPAVINKSITIDKPTNSSLSTLRTFQPPVLPNSKCPPTNAITFNLLPQHVSMPPLDLEKRRQLRTSSTATSTITTLDQLITAHQNNCTAPPLPLFTAPITNHQLTQPSPKDQYTSDSTSTCASPMWSHPRGQGNKRKFTSRTNTQNANAFRLTDPQSREIGHFVAFETGDWDRREVAASLHRHMPALTAMQATDLSYLAMECISIGARLTRDAIQLPGQPNMPLAQKWWAGVRHEQAKPTTENCTPAFKQPDQTSKDTPIKLTTPAMKQPDQTSKVNDQIIQMQVTTPIPSTPEPPIPSISHQADTALEDKSLTTDADSTPMLQLCISCDEFEAETENSQTNTAPPIQKKPVTIVPLMDIETTRPRGIKPNGKTTYLPRRQLNTAGRWRSRPARTPFRNSRPWTKRN